VVSNQFSPMILDLKNYSNESSYFFGVGDTLSVSGLFKSDTIEPTNDDENMIMPFIKLANQAETKMVSVGIKNVFQTEVENFDTNLENVPIGFYQIQMKTTLEGKSSILKSRLRFGFETNFRIHGKIYNFRLFSIFV
jgi:hypothetical protein